MKLLAAVVVFVIGAVYPELATAQQDTGIDFANMPVGCRWERKLSNGQVWNEEFTGRKGSVYVVRATNAKKPSEFVSSTEFNLEGHRVKLTWANGSWSTFTPFSCFAVVGKCTYVYENSDKRRDEIRSVAKLRGNVLTTRSSVGETNFGDEQTKLGPFRVWISNRSPNYWTKVTKFERCGLSPSS
ncbi:MAG: hypothetical protein OEY05_04475 [Paracoccaceae bacterium]|jgi:hypothetical protein|nr:hypothetical protein [Paracoccaceae bacterium]